MIYLPKQIPNVSAQAIDALSPAFDRSHVLLAGDWLYRCGKDLAQLWRNGELWAITEVQDTKDGRALHIVACAGEYDNGELLAEIEGWAKAIGCADSFFTGRRGWAKKLPGYTIETITMKKGL
jgi:hypothetical protein